MISYSEACNLIEKEFANLTVETEEVILEEAMNRTLAENIIADVNLPSFDNSAVDGIAVKFDPNIREWNISEEIFAGNYSDVKNGEAVLIMTGAKIPPIFDTIIPLENYFLNENHAKLLDNISIRENMNIRPKASDIAEGEIVVKENTFITARNIATLAACGKSKLKVNKKIQVAVLATGDELVEVDEKPFGDKLRVSNNYGLTAAVNSLHQNGINYGFVNDNYELTKEKFTDLIDSDCDIIITTGGVSVGKYDYVKDIFTELGVKEIFWRANIKPGKPAYFGKLEKNGNTKLVFGLPGNPVSCMVNFDVYIKNCILNKIGLTSPIKVKAELLTDVKKKDGKRHFVRGFLNFRNGNYFVTSQLSQSSGNLVGFSSANCLIELDEQIRNPKKGEIVRCIPI